MFTRRREDLLTLNLSIFNFFLFFFSLQLIASRTSRRGFDLFDTKPENETVEPHRDPSPPEVNLLFGSVRDLPPPETFRFEICKEILLAALVFLSCHRCVCDEQSLCET